MASQVFAQGGTGSD